jgi:hypothetical protein
MFGRSGQVGLGHPLWLMAVSGVEWWPVEAGVCQHLGNLEHQNSDYFALVGVKIMNPGKTKDVILTHVTRCSPTAVKFEATPPQ